MVGLAMAAKTSGYTSEGPGPINTLSGSILLSILTEFIDHSVHFPILKDTGGAYGKALGLNLGKILDLDSQCQTFP